MNRSKLIRRSATALGIAAILTGAGTVVTVHQYRALLSERMEAADRDAENVLTTFDDHIDRLLAYADGHMRAVRTLYVEKGGRGAMEADGGDGLRRQIEGFHSPNTENFAGPIGITDADGYAVFGTVRNFRRDVSIAEMPYFQRLRDAPDDVLIINSTRYAKFSGAFTYRLARPIRIDGRFAGAIIMTLRPEGITEFYNKFDLGPHGTLTVTQMAEGKLIARQPSIAVEAYDRPLGDIAAWEAAGDPAAIRPDPLAAALPALDDGMARRYRVGSLADHPIMVAVGWAPADVEDGLADVRREMIAINLGFTVGNLLIAALVIALMRGANDLARARAVAESARARKQAILGAASDGICGIDDAGDIAFINDSGLRLLGWTRGREPGRRLPPLLDPTAPGGGIVVLDGADGRPIDVEYSVTDADRAATAAGDGERPVARVVVFRDVTERRAMERKLARTLEELERFAHVASHDLRQPLRVIASYLALLKAEVGSSLDANQAEYLGFAMDAARRMGRRVTDLLEYSRTGVAPATTVVALERVVADAIADLTVAAQETGATITVADPPPQVEGNAGELTRLFENLIGNAIKYRAPDRAPVVVIRCRPVDERDWEFRVEDNGSGIASEHFGRAFGIFQRLVAHDAGDAPDGSGIGLAVCKKIVEHHGGRIWIESTLGKGSTFVFTLPRRA